MSTHRYNSWGRTRRPKNITGKDGTGVTVLAHNATPSGITATDGSGGYVTENQRYLHITVDPSSNGAPDQDIEIWAYHHATAVWSYFSIINCEAITVPTSFIIEIYGIDRVAFVRDTGAWGDAPDAVYASCSTF